MKGLAYFFHLALFVFIVVNASYAQKPHKDKGVFIEPKNEFWDTIKASCEEFNKKPVAPVKAFKMDFSGYNLPKTTSEFKQIWHSPPVSQASTGTCWCFSTTSYYESEIYRLFKKEIKLSEMYTVYWEYVEKAIRFVKERGNSAFGEGSEANAVPRIWRKYGCVPENIYTGLMPGQRFHDHSKMFEEMNHYLEFVKKNDAWNENTVVSTIKSILNHYIGVPPETVKVNNKEMTALEYFKNEIKLNLDDYVDILSLLEKPYFQQVEYEVTDNWWKSADYYNTPLDEYMTLLKRAVKDGYSVAIGGDGSEPGYEAHVGVAMIPSWDIPSEYIDEYAREFRFANKTTTDDHGIHVVGYKEIDGKTWFLIKDSGSGSRNGSNKGYYFYHEDYVKLKMMSFTVHRSAVEDLLKKFK